MKKSLCLFILTVLLTLSLTGCGISVPRPKVKTAEFDFSVTYEYGGEAHTISGVYVCEYVGLSWSLDGGYSRDWSGYIKGGDYNDHFLIDTIDDGDEVILSLNFYPTYFMGDHNFNIHGVPAPCIMIYDTTDEGGLRVLYDEKDVEEICGAKIISYKYGDPIENSFSLFY